MLFAPPRLKVLKNLKVVKMGKNITCGIFTTIRTTRDNMVRAVCCEQKIQPRITRICTNGDVMQKFFGLPKKIFVSIRVIRGKKNSVPSLARTPRGVCVWRSRIADRYNAPHSVSRVRSGFRDDEESALQVPFIAHQ